MSRGSQSHLVATVLREARRWRVIASFAVYTLLAPFGLALFALLGLLDRGDPVARAARFQRVMGWAYAFMHHWLRVTRILDFDPRDALPGMPPTPCVVVANHPTLADVTAITAAMGSACTVAKPELYRRPVLHPLLSNAGLVEGPGDDPIAAARALDEATERLDRGFRIVIFPEGTRSPEGGLRPFGRAAFEIACRARVPVVSVLVTCEPPWLTKRTPLARPPMALPVLRLRMLATDDPASVGWDSRALRDTVERRFQQIVPTTGGQAPQPSKTSGESEPCPTPSKTA